MRDMTPEEYAKLAMSPRDETGEIIMSSLIKWRVYYGDGTTADNTTHALADLPAWDCQVIVQHDEKHNRNAPDGNDFYIYRLDAQHWFHMDYTGLIDALAHEFENIGKVLIGRYISNATYDAIKNRASADPDFQLPSAGKNRFKR